MRFNVERASVVALRVYSQISKRLPGVLIMAILFGKLTIVFSDICHRTVLMLPHRFPFTAL